MTCCNSSSDKILSGLLNDYCVYWEPDYSSPSKFGEIGYKNPVELKCKWQVSRKSITSKEGKKISSSATVHLMNGVATEGYLWRGRLKDAPDSPPKENEIIGVDQTDSVSNDETLWQAYI